MSLFNSNHLKCKSVLIRLIRYDECFLYVARDLNPPPSMFPCCKHVNQSLACLNEKLSFWEFLDFLCLSAKNTVHLYHLLAYEQHGCAPPLTLWSFISECVLWDCIVLYYIASRYIVGLCQAVSFVYHIQSKRFQSNLSESYDVVSYWLGPNWPTFLCSESQTKDVMS